MSTGRSSPSQETIDRRNEFRRDKYLEDNEYRETAKSRAREFQRQRRGGPLLFDSRSNLNRLEDLGANRLVSFPHEEGEYEFLCFSDKEIAETLGISLSALQKWYVSEAIPRPVCRARMKTGTFGRDDVQSVRVFVEPEMVAIITALGPHQAQMKYFVASKHLDTVYAILEAVRKVRQEYDIGDE